MSIMRKACKHTQLIRRRVMKICMSSILTILFHINFGVLDHIEPVIHGLEDFLSEITGSQVLFDYPFMYVSEGVNDFFPLEVFQ